MSEVINLGFDDIDTPRGGCTTHFASILVEFLSELGAEWADYPNLIRLNPNIPYRTRGNGAVALRFHLDNFSIKDILTQVEEMIGEYVKEDYPNTNPGVVCIEGNIPAKVKWIANQALWRVVPTGYAKRVISEFDISAHSEGNNRGLVGALAAIGNLLDSDYTYECITYRGIGETDVSRGVDHKSVVEMDRITGEKVFSNLDYNDGRILIEPHGPDPVLYGIRGETAEDVLKASKLVKSVQEIDRWMIFRTNQGTGQHLQNKVGINSVRPYMSAVVEGIVSNQPQISEGGHVFFKIGDDFGEISCAVYEPTGYLREIVLQLSPGDSIRASSGVRPSSRNHGLTLNIEGIEVVELAENMMQLNPICPVCLKRMKSAGRDKGFKCVKCGFRDRDGVKVETLVERKLSPGYYLPPISAQRHLTRPEARLSKNNKGIPSLLIDKWHSP